MYKNSLLSDSLLVSKWFDDFSPKLQTFINKTKNDGESSKFDYIGMKFIRMFWNSGLYTRMETKYINPALLNTTYKVRANIINHSNEPCLTDSFEAGLTRILYDKDMKKWFNTTCDNLCKKYFKGKEQYFYENYEYSLFILLIFYFEKQFYLKVLESDCYTAEIIQDISSYYVRCTAGLKDIYDKLFTYKLQLSLNPPINELIKFVERMSEMYIQSDVAVTEHTDALSEIVAPYYSTLSYIGSVKNDSTMNDIYDRMDTALNENIISQLSFIIKGLSIREGAMDKIRDGCTAFDYELNKCTTHVKDRIYKLVGLSNGIPNQVLKYFKKGEGIYSPEFIDRESRIYQKMQR